MNDFIPKSPVIYNYFYKEHTEIDDELLYNTQQQDPVLKQLLFWKKYKIPPPPQPRHSQSEKIKGYYTTTDVFEI